jgi:alanine racemase
MFDHAATLTIDAAALAANWRLLATRMQGGACGACVKADAYGLGIELAVPILAGAGCRTFFVAHLAEGMRARAVAPEAAIYVLNGLASAHLEAYSAHRLRPVLGTEPEIAAWADHFRAHPDGEPAALHVDTGMNRLGLRLAEARARIATQSLADLGIGLVMTHFASSEYPDAADTRAQIAAFAEVKALLRAPDSPNRAIPTSLCNSSGLFIDNIDRHDLGRPGYALYGGNPTPGQSNPMHPVIRLEAPIIQINAVPKGEALGYNGNWIAARDSRVATLSCGYADGLPRNLGNKPDHPGGIAIVAGRECPYAGNVSMDLLAIDITDLPENTVRPGDPVTLIGDSIDIDRLGALGRTIGYEILTSLGRRYKRVVVG